MPKKAQLNVFWAIPGVLLALLVAGFINSMGGETLTTLAKNVCNGKGYTYYVSTCYSTFNSTDNCASGTGCVVYQSSYALNITNNALEGQKTLGEWQDNLATVGVFAIIIAALMGAVAYVGVGRGFGR